MNRTRDYIDITSSVIVQLVPKAANEVIVSYSTRELNQLKRIVSIAQQLITKAEANNRTRAPKDTKKSSAKVSSVKRIRRTGSELIKFRKKLVAERNKGLPVSELAKKYGVSLAYIYQL